MFQVVRKPKKSSGTTVLYRRFAMLNLILQSDFRYLMAEDELDSPKWKLEELLFSLEAIEVQRPQ
jgi:hypothetical protein